MAQKVQFLGFKKIFSSAKSSMAENFLYFVRDNGSAVEGELWFNGTCYGKCRDVEINDIQRTLADFLSGGTTSGTTVKDYIDNLIGGKDASVTGTSSDGHVTIQIDEADGALTAATVTTVDIASASATTQELNTIEGAVGLNEDGSHIQSSGRYTSGATTTEAEIAALDTALQAVADKTITEGSSTENYVNLSVASSATGTVISIDDSALKTAIEAMDYSGVTANGQAIINVTEADGKITATQGDIAAAHVTIADAGNLFEATNVEDALAEIDAAYKAADEAIVGDATESGNTLGKLEDRIEELSADAKEYHIVKTTSGLPETIKERYSLVDADGNVSGDTVDIPKDSHIVSITYITEGEHAQNLEYVYIDVCGATKTEYVDMSELVIEAEFASGVVATNHVVHGVVDPQSETFLTVGADGFKLSGVQDAIDDAKTAATAYTQSEIQKLDVTGDTEVAGQYVAAIEETDGVVAVKTRANVSEAILNNYTKGSDATAVAATDTVNQAISKLENQVDAAKAAATTKVVEGTDAGNNMTITPSTSATDGSVTYTISLTDIASASALTAEENARISGDTELQENLQTTADTLTAMIDDLTDGLQAELDAVEYSLGFDNTGYTNEGTYISGETVTGDIKLLDTALDNIEERFMEALEKEIDDRTSADSAIRESLAETAATLTDMIEDEASARTAADNALDARLDVVEEKYITGATVNGVDATVTNHVADVTIDAGDIELGEKVTGTTGGIHFDATANTQDVFQSIVDALNQSVATSYTGVTSNDKSINLTPTTNGQDLSVNVKTLQLADVQAGETEVKKDESTGALYGVMYWIDEETA